MVYFSELSGRPVYDSDRKMVGKLTDMVFVDGKEYAEVTHLIYSGEDKYRRKIPFRHVNEFKEKESGKGIDVYLDQPIDKIIHFFPRDDDLRVGQILDKQVVDVNGAKIVRVNDVVLGKISKKLCVVAVAVGGRSFAARLGIPWVSSKASDKLEANVIHWHAVELLEPKLHDIHLNIQKSKIADMHSEDIADVMEDLSHRERVLIFKALDQKKAVQTLLDAEPEVQESVFKDMKLERVKDLLEDIPTDEAADILSLMPMEKQNYMLSLMRKNTADKIKKILDLPSDSAGAIMETNFISVPADNTAQGTIDYLRKNRPSSDISYHIYVTDPQQRLIGVLRTRNLLTADADARIYDIMKSEVIHVGLSTPKEDIAKAMARYDLFTLPVVDGDNLLRGVVKIDDVLSEIMPESWKRDKYRPMKIMRRINGNSRKTQR
ncbi:MAG: CBS domain-containing protein [Candidatus Altiarchaeota archaeon]